MVMQITPVTPVIFLLLIACFAAPQDYRTERSKINDQDTTTTQLSKIDLGGTLSYHRRSRETIQEQNDTREEAKDKIEESTEGNKTTVPKGPAATTETETTAAATTTVTTTEETTIGATTATIATMTATTTAATTATTAAATTTATTAVATTTATTAAATTTATTTTATTKATTAATTTATTAATTTATAVATTTATTAAATAATTTIATTEATTTAIAATTETETEENPYKTKDLPPYAIIMAGGTTMTFAFRPTPDPSIIGELRFDDFSLLGKIAVFLSGKEYRKPKKKREMKRAVVEPDEMETAEKFEIYPTSKDAATALRVVRTLKRIRGAPATVAQMMFDMLHASTLPPPGRSFPLTDYVQERLVLEERIRHTQASPKRLRAVGRGVLREMEDALMLPAAGSLNLDSLSIARALRIQLCFSQFWLDVVKHFASDPSNNISAEDVKIFHRVVHYVQPCTKSPPPRPPISRKPSRLKKTNNPKSAQA